VRKWLVQLDHKGDDQLDHTITVYKNTMNKDMTKDSEGNVRYSDSVVDGDHSDDK